jgi:hypothetical protein
MRTFVVECFVISVRNIGGDPWMYYAGCKQAWSKKCTCVDDAMNSLKVEIFGMFAVQRSENQIVWLESLSSCSERDRALYVGLQGCSLMFGSTNVKVVDYYHQITIDVDI